MKGNSRTKRLRAGSASMAVIGLMTFSASAQDVRKVISHPSPDYPATGKEMALTGTVKVEVVIGVDGQIKNTRVIGGNPIFVEATLEALKKWKYAPANTETTATLSFNFRP